jgi:formylglycine-generating enzyme required for sulfatase activity
MLLVLAIFSAFLCFAQSRVPAAPAKRGQALVIANSNYQRLPALPQAIDEANLISTELANSGFTVSRLNNRESPAFMRDIEAFLQRIQPGETCVIYYSGHAIQIIDDDNYLLPVNFDPAADQDIQERAYRVLRLQDRLEGRKAGLKIVILEAPRRIDRPIRGATGVGLMAPDLSETRETLVAYAAYAGQVIPSEQDGKPGLFTRALAERMRQPGSSLIDVFEQAKRDVGKQSQQRQLPHVVNSIVSTRFFFHDPVETPIAPPPPPVTIVRSDALRQNRTDRLDYVLIPPGKFKMGCVPKDDRCEEHEKPRHDATISHAFWMGRTEVEVEAYRKFVDESGKKYKMPGAPIGFEGWRITNFPIVRISWEEANTYCKWMGGRLPTETEWEYAARGGVADEIVPLDQENSREKANFAGRKGNDRFDVVAPVGKFDPNRFGLFDMAGNVWEWVSDWYGPYSPNAAIDPKGPATGKEHVVRGGSFDSDPRQHLRISFRKRETGPTNNIGFRCVMDDTPETQKRLQIR